MGTLIMWSVLALVTILTCHLSLGQDEASEDIQLPGQNYSCPEEGKRFYGYVKETYYGIPKWTTCGDLCDSVQHQQFCKFWSWRHAWWPSPSPTPTNRMCLLMTDAGDDGLVDNSGWTSGVRGC